MARIPIIITVILFLLAGVQGASAQRARSLDGNVMEFRPDLVEEGNIVTSVPTVISGAVVAVMMPGDTIYTVSDKAGKFHFDGISRRCFRVRVECLGYERWEKDVDADRLDYGLLNVYLKESREALDAAVVKEEMPVFEVIGDTLKYNVAATQKISRDDMLGDVLARLPGVSFERGGLAVNGEQIKRVYINDRLVFGDNVSDPLRFLAGSEVVSLRVYDQETREERAGLVHKDSRKERVVNVATRSRIETALVAQGIAGYGRNFEDTGTEMDNRYMAGVTGNWFSEKMLLSFNAYLNNIGRTNEYRAVSDISSVPSAYSRVGYVGAKVMRKFKGAELGNSLSASYSYGNRKSISEKSLTRIYSPDTYYSSRTYDQDSRTLSREDAHNVMLSFNSYSKYIPSVNLSFSVADNDMHMSSVLKDVADGKQTGYRQQRIDTGEDYRYAADIKKDFPIGGFRNHVSAKISGGWSSGYSLQRDTSFSSSDVTSFVTTPLGRNLDASVRLGTTRKIRSRKLIWSAEGSWTHQHASVRKFRYADAVAEANLDSLTSDVHTYNYDRYRISTGLKNSFSAKGFSYSVDVGFEYARQKYENVLPYEDVNDKGYLTFVPNVHIGYYNGLGGNTNLRFAIIPGLPSSQQVSSRFDDLNPMFVSTGNPDLKKSVNYKLSINGSYLLGQKHSLGFVAGCGWVDDRIMPVTRYFPESVSVRGYRMPAGSTLTTYDNVDGSVAANAHISWNSMISALKLLTDMSVNYDFAREPSYVEDRQNLAHRHSPRLSLDVRTNFSTRYVLSVNSTTSASFVSNTEFDDVSYLDQIVSVKSTNNMTSWAFFNAEYVYTLREPLKNTGSKIQDHMLNAILGFKLPGSGFEINLSCYDILDRTTSFKTAVLQNYTQTSFSPDFGRIWMVSFVYRFNSTQKGGSRPRFGLPAPSLGRDYESGSNLML